MTETKNKERKVGENGQYLVTVRKRKEWKRLFRYLTENGYSNVHSLTVFRRPTRPPVVVIDERKRVFFLTNVTCLAAASSCGKRAITCETYFSDADFG